MKFYELSLLSKQRLLEQIYMFSDFIILMIVMSQFQKFRRKKLYGVFMQ